MKKTNFILGFMLILLLAMSTSLMADGTPPSGLGTEVSPYQVATLDNLLWISTNNSSWSASSYIIQTADIDASATSDWNGDAGFSPIGTSSSNIFRGHYNGQGNTISGLTIDRGSTEYVGLFGYKYLGSISNLHLRNVDITGKKYVGGLAGFCNNTSITACSVTGSVTATSQYAGLFVGFFDSSTINQCYTRDGTVSSIDYVGGFCGQNDSSTDIVNCYADNVSITASNNYGGGFVGYIEGTITNCYSTGSVNSGSYNGGFVGRGNGTSTNCFWDTDTSGQATSYGGTGKTTEEMKTQSTFTSTSPGWNFTTIWEMIGYNYPRLKVNPDQALPVNLSSFYALYISGTPSLYWTTQTEENNAYWNVYRGTNDNFEAAYHINANDPVPGNGSTNNASDYIYIDTAPVVQNATYLYWIEDVSTDGESEIHGPITLYVPFEDTPIIPATYGLQQNYPNPFNPSTAISFALSAESDVEVIIFNVKGGKIKSIFNDHVYADQITSVIWDGNDANGKPVSSGVYFYKLITDNKVYQKKMLLVK